MESKVVATGMNDRWAVILAGGDGKRLLPLTRRLAGDDRPKQFCKILGDETLFDQTLSRVARVVRSDRVFSVVTKVHERFYRAGQIPPDERLLVQPCNRGTGPAIVYSVARLFETAPGAVVGFFPSDHYFADDEAFSDSVRQAFVSAKLYDAVTLLGIAPNQPETAYGWVEPAEPLMTQGRGHLFTVRRFWEKPSSALAIELMRRGCFWNSFVMVGRVVSFLNLIEQAVPHLLKSVRTIAHVFFTKDEEAGALDLYRRIPSSSFSTDVLSVCPDNLAVLCSRALEWADLGDVRRALFLMGREGIRSLQSKAADRREMARLSAAG